MNVSQLILSVSAIVVAVAAVVIALRIHAAVQHLRMTASSISSLNLWLFNYLAASKIHQTHPGHHVVLEPPPVAAVWMWHDGRWELHSEGDCMCHVGSAPSRAGSFEGECVIAQSLTHKS